MAIYDKNIKNGNGISYSKEVDSSADWSGVTNSTYFKDLSDSLIYYKSSGGTVISIFEESISANIANADLTFDTNHYADLNSNTWKVKNGYNTLLETNSNGIVTVKDKFVFSELSGGTGDWVNNVGFGHSAFTSTFNDNHSIIINSFGSMGINCPTGQRINFDQDNTVVFCLTPNGKFVYGNSDVIGSEEVSLQGDTLIKTSDNSVNTRGFKVTDVNNSSLLDIRNNGQIGYGGEYINTVGHKFRNANLEGTIAQFDSDTSGDVSFSVSTQGRISTTQSSQTVLLSYRQSGQSFIKLYDAGVESIRFNKGGSFMTGSLSVGSATGKANARFSINQASSVVSQQLFFGNITTTTAGRLGSDTGFNADQKGFECFDTDINKKFVWNGTAWEQIGGGGTPTLNNGEVFVGNASNVATSVAMTGDALISNTGAVTIQPDVVTYDKMQDVTAKSVLGNSTGAGTIAEIPIIENYISAGSNRNNLDNTSNWDVNGNYTGTTLSGTYQGQAHYNGNYWFTAVADNTWIRLIRG